MSDELTQCHPAEQVMVNPDWVPSCVWLSALPLAGLTFSFHGSDMVVFLSRRDETDSECEPFSPVSAGRKRWRQHSRSGLYAIVTLERDK